MIKELEEVLEIQKEVDALKAKIYSKATEAKNKADKSINARKMQIEQELTEIVGYVQMLGAYNMGRCNFGSQIIARVKNYPIRLIIDDSKYYLGHVPDRGTIVYGYHSSGKWDRDFPAEYTSPITDFICSNWDDIKAFLINDIKTVAQENQTKDLSDAMSQLQMQISRVFI